MYKAAVLTVSDRCARGERRDEGGPADCRAAASGRLSGSGDRRGTGRTAGDRSRAAALVR